MSYSYFDYLQNKYDEEHYEHYDAIGWNGTYPPSPYIKPLEMEHINAPFFTFTIVMGILSVMITVLVCFKVRASYHTSHYHDQIAISLTLICLILHLGENFMSPFAYYYKYISYHAKAAYWTLLLWDAFWCLTRISIYSVFIYRFYLVWKSLEVLHLQSNQHRTPLFVFFALILVTQFIFWLFWMIIFFDLVTFKDPELVTFNFMRIYWVFLALDICFIALLGVLLIKSIVLLIKNVLTNAPTIALSTMMGSTTESTNAITTTSRLTGTNTESTTASSGERVIHIQDPEIAQNLIHLATKISLLLCVSMLSSSLYQFLWMISYEIEDMKLYLVSFTWSLDGVINMLCMYLSMDLAKHHYAKVCVDGCKCHKCALRCLERMVKGGKKNEEDSDELIEPEPNDVTETETLRVFRSRS